MEKACWEDLAHVSVVQEAMRGGVPLLSFSFFGDPSDGDYAGDSSSGLSPNSQSCQVELPQKHSKIPHLTDALDVP